MILNASFANPTSQFRLFWEGCSTTPPKTNSSPLKIGRAQKGNNRIPTIIFQGLCLLVSGMVISMKSSKESIPHRSIHSVMASQPTPTPTNPHTPPPE